MRTTTPFSQLSYINSYFTVEAIEKHFVWFRVIWLMDNLLYIYVLCSYSPITKLLANDLSVFTLQNNRTYFHFNAPHFRTMLCAIEKTTENEITFMPNIFSISDLWKVIESRMKRIFLPHAWRENENKKKERKEIGKKVYFFVKWILKCMDDCYP